MTTGTAISCSREAESHGGPLRKIDGQYVCQDCWAKEQGIDIKKSAGRPVLCPRCGEVLMTRFRGGRINLKSMSMKGNKAVLKCSCGYEKTVPNPFGGRQNRDEVARRRLQSEARQRKLPTADLKEHEVEEGT